MMKRTGSIEILLPPTGNHRNGQRGFASAPKQGGRGNASCPHCARRISVGVMHFRTPEYQTWLEGVGWQLKAGIGAVGGRVRVYVWLFGGKGFAVNRDLDNIQKCIGDALVQSGILASDDVRSLASWRIEYIDRDEHLRRLGDNRPSRAEDLKARCMVRVEPLD